MTGRERGGRRRRRGGGEVVMVEDWRRGEKGVGGDEVEGSQNVRKDIGRMGEGEGRWRRRGIEEEEVIEE